MMAQLPGPGANAVRAAKDALRKKLKRALASLSDQEKLEQSKHLVRRVSSGVQLQQC
jgi:5-formyltetrahydrofolate cyclo-ligase